MYKKALSFFFAAVVLGLVLIFFSTQNKKAIKNLDSRKNITVKVDTNIASLVDISNRTTIYFGVSISQTGRFAVEGKNVIQGYDLWQEHVNQNGGIKIGEKIYNIKIKYYDDNSNIERVKENITRLITQDKVDFILGPFSSGFNLAASKITEKYGKIMIESGGASDSIFTRNQDLTFATQTSASWWFKDFFDMISQIKPAPETYALITPDKLFTRSVAKGAQIWAGIKNIKEVYYQVVDKKTDNFIPYLLDMAKKKPDIVILTSHYKDAVDFSIQLSSLEEFKPKAVVMTIGPSELNYVNDVGKGANGMIGVTQWVADSSFQGPVFGTPENYVKEFKDKYGQAPTYQDAQSSATGVIYQLALEKCSLLDSKQVLKNLQSLDVETFYGKIKYDSRGMNIGHKMALVQIQNNRMETIWPPESAIKNVNFPLDNKNSVK